MLGEATGSATRDTELLTVVETNIDDMNPQFVEIVTERLFAAGALDVWTTPIGMKKGRTALQISALCRPVDAERASAILIEQTTTLGVRQYQVDRIAADRQFESVETRWGTVRVKLKIWNGRVIDANPEYDDCAAIARRRDAGLREVWSEAHRIAEAFIGRPAGRSDGSPANHGREAGERRSGPG
jgi:uncharacterized protein (DUF111 family)